MSPIKIYVGKNSGNQRKGIDRDTPGRPSKRSYKMYDVTTGDPLDEKDIMKSPTGNAAIDLTPVMHKTIIDLVTQGNFLNVAVQAAGISYETFKTWMKKASVLNQANMTKQDAVAVMPYIVLMNDIAQASAQAEIDRVGIIDTASKNGNWTGAAWWLERRFPRRWGKRQLVQHEGAISHSHEVTQKIIANKTATTKAIDIFESVTSDDDSDN